MSKLSKLNPIPARLRARKMPGGIKPAALKARSLRSRIMPMPLPPLLTLLLSQYSGEPARADVKVGDQVLKYQRLASPPNPFGIAVHAPTSGSITAIENVAVAGHSESVSLGIKLTPDGHDRATVLDSVDDYLALDRLKLLRKIADAGICGMGGAGFPTAEKLHLGIARGTELVIINAVECEPYISADQALLRERANEVVIGADILRHCCAAPRCVIAIGEDMTDAIAALKPCLAHSSIELILIEARYPAGSERQLVKALTGREVPGDQYPSDLGILTFNAGTARACYLAVIEGKPSISRITTLTGAMLQTPKNFDALIGTPVSFLFGLCGVDTSKHHRTLVGGPLMGIESDNDDVPVTKTSNCLIAVSADEFPDRSAEQACIRCGFCANACPVNLLPQQLYRFARTNDQQQLREHGLLDCIECGACDYVCPSQIPLVQYFHVGKRALDEQQQIRRQSEGWQARFQFHQYRLKRDKEAARERRKQAEGNAPAQVPEKRGSGFSREQARQEIADAVQRVKAKQAAAKLAQVDTVKIISRRDDEESL